MTRPRLRVRQLWTLAAIAGMLWGSLSPAQNTAPPPPTPNEKPKAETKPAADAAEKQKDERIIIEWADRLTQEGDLYHLRGNVIFAREDMKLYCDEADYDEQADTAKARGHLRITDPNSVITGDLLDADFGKELAIVTGNVTIVTQKKENKPDAGKPAMSLEKPKGNGHDQAKEANPPGPDAPPATAKPKDENGKEPEHFEDYWQKKSTITCERVEYFYADDVKKMIATPRVKAVQSKTAWADTAVFEDLARTVTLTGNVVVTNDKGDEMRCAKAVIWIDEDRAEATGASGVTLRKKKSEAPKPPPAETKPVPQPAPTPQPQPQPAPQPGNGP